VTVVHRIVLHVKGGKYQVWRHIPYKNGYALLTSINNIIGHIRWGIYRGRE
jgi:hypothetical protein